MARFNLKTFLLLITYLCIGLSFFQVYNSCKRSYVTGNIRWELDEEWTLIWAKEGWSAHSIVYRQGKERLTTPHPEFKEVDVIRNESYSTFIEEMTIHLPSFKTETRFAGGIIVDYR